MRLQQMIPPAALPIVREIRAKVPRPTTLPEPDCPTYSKDYLRWWSTSKFPDEECCPMGLLPYARSPTPVSGFDLGRNFPVEEIEAFFTWWDSQTDPQAAVSAVWDNPIPAPQ